MGATKDTMESVDLSKLWDNEESRAVEVLGGEQVKYTRTVEDKLILKFTIEEWCKLFNLAPGYTPCASDYKTYNLTQPIYIHFVRKVSDERA